MLYCQIVNVNSILYLDSEGIKNKPCLVRYAYLAGYACLHSYICVGDLDSYL